MRSTNLKSVLRAEIKMRSGFEVVSHPTIEPLREGFFCKLDISVSGEAPKDFIAVYVHGRGRKVQMTSWPAYIAKVGHKFYPNESITEHLLTRIGELLGMAMAASRLMWVRGQLRFLSEYFLKPDESLLHGAEIFAGYLADESFVEQVGHEKREREIFTFQVVEDAVMNAFPEQAGEIMNGFVRLLGFDTIVGNNDRHHFNWGVITHITGKRSPRFSPIYDTARGLFWNIDEEGLRKQEGRMNDFLQNYTRKCYPMIGWDGSGNLNHFEVIQKIAQKFPCYQPALHQLAMLDLPAKVAVMLESEFAGLFSSRRSKFIVACLQRRLEQYVDVVTK
jgi:hypothetical protein